MEPYLYPFCDGYRILLCGPDWLWTYSSPGLPLPPKCWHHTPVSPHLAYTSFLLCYLQNTFTVSTYLLLNNTELYNYTLYSQNISSLFMYNHAELQVCMRGTNTLLCLIYLFNQIRKIKAFLFSSALPLRSFNFVSHPFLLSKELLRQANWQGRLGLQLSEIEHFFFALYVSQDTEPRPSLFFLVSFLMPGITFKILFTNKM